MKKEIRFYQADKDTSPELKRGFIKVYQEAFSGPPYFEEYTERYVAAKVWEPHLSGGGIILALAGDQVIGLGCCIPLMNLKADDPNIEVKAFLQSKETLPFDLEKTGYMSEIAVLEKYRRQGIGKRLAEERFSWLQARHLDYYVLRTAADCSNSLNLYRSLGAEQANFIQDVSRAEVVSASRQRIFLYGRTV
jgi:ribosomal protein S18 acetylase RimI-like enzyme